LKKLLSLIGWQDKPFYKTWLAIALPIMLQQGLASALYLIDNVMVGQLGDIPIAAVGVGNQLTFLMQVFGFGITNGVAIFTAQYFGRKDYDGIHRVHGIALMLTFGVSLAFTLLGLFASGFVANIYSNDPAVIALAQDYLSIAAFAYIFQLISQVYGGVLRSSGHASLPMLTTLAGVVTNGVLNYVFIFGVPAVGIPAMGVQGAALATVIGSAVASVLVVILSYTKKTCAAARLKELFGFQKDHLREFLKVSLPVFINEALWSIGISMYSVLYGILGTSVQSAMQIYTTIDKIGFIMMAGLGSGAGVIVGNTIGEGKPELAKEYAKRMLIVTPMAMFCFGLVLQLLIPVFMSLYTVTPYVAQLAENVARCYALVMWIYSINYTIVIGTLRAGGETKWASIVDLSGLWLVSLPVAYFSGLVLGWEIWAVYLLSVLGDITKAVIGLLHIRKGTWIKNLK